MASTYTDIGTELMTTGENAGNWGTKTNTNLQIIEEALRGYVSQSIAGGAQTTALTYTDGTVGDAARNMVIALTGTITGNQVVTVTAKEKMWIIDNQTSGAYTVQFMVSGQTGVTWGASDKGTKILYCNGTDVIDTDIGGVGAYDLNGATLTLDADGDTDITADTDDQIDIRIAGADDFQFTANTFTAQSGSTIAAQALTATTVTASGIIKTDDTTAATSTTDGSLQTDGGLSVAADAIIGDDLKLLSDSAVLSFGADSDTTLTHTDGTGLTLNSTNKLLFRDTALSISSSADGQLDIDADTEVEIATTTLDLNGALDVSGASQFSGAITVGVDDTGLDVKFFGASAGAYALWDESANLLDLRGATAAGAGLLKLTTGELTVVDADKLGRIDFQAPLESDGTDAVAIAASIWAEADDTFSTSVNNTDLVFALGKSEAATEKFRFTADNEIGIAGANYGTDGQVLTSGGAGAAVAWEDVTGSVTAINNATANELVTIGATTTELDAEANLTFDGTTLTTTALTVDDVAVNGKVVTMTGSTSDTAVLTAGTNGTLSIVTTDAAAAAANIQITADGTVDIDSAGVLTLDSGAAINIEPAAGSAILLDGTISVDAGVVTGATSITSTAFVGDITGDVTGNTSGTAATVTTAAQTNITSLGTLTALTVDNMVHNGDAITMTPSTSDTVTMTAATNGAFSLVTVDTAAAAANIQITADGTFEVDATTITLDSAGDINLDAAGNNITLKSGGTALLDFVNSSSDVVIKPMVDAKDIIFQQYDGTEVARIEDNATFNVSVAGKFAYAGTAVTATAAELNYSDLATLGTSAASKVLSADANNLSKITGAIYIEEATLTFDATQDWDVRASPVAKVTLTANVTFDAPSNPTTGQFISIVCIQDGTGSRTIAWNAVFEFASDTAPTATTTANLGDMFNFRYNGAKWLEVGRNLALTLS